MTQLSEALLRRMPKVALHEHLDGGLRTATIIELAREVALDLPASDAEGLREWFERGANKGSLAEYLQGFAVTCGVMQTRAALERVAAEALHDLAADGVVYAELRFAPEFHTAGGLGTEAVMDAVLTGLERGGTESGTQWGLIVCGMRSSPPEMSLKMAELAVAFRDRGCFGFDLAGDEFGNPPKDHLDAFEFCQRENFNITIHAGEAFGAPSIWQALQFCGAHRIGHCTRLVEDMVIADGKPIALGRLAQYVLDHRIPLEVCLSSNVQTGAVASLAEHPLRHYLRLNFRVTLNSDNRLMSGTCLTKEHMIAQEHFDLGFDDHEKLVINAMKSAFTPYRQRCALIFGILKPQFAALRQELGLPPASYPRRRAT
ncbi:MAG: adenosine deaminase [Planctomycetes bacterium]|nr:adenosine deaminase [Planctomycetota bacterium]